MCVHICVYTHTYAMVRGWRSEVNTGTPSTIGSGPQASAADVVNPGPTSPALENEQQRNKYSKLFCSMRFGILLLVFFSSLSICCFVTFLQMLLLYSSG